MDQFDLLAKSLLKDAEETPSAHVWEGVSKGLDKAAGKKAAILWLRRASIATVAAAAVITAVILLNSPTTTSTGQVSSQTEDQDLIAVVQTPEPVLIEAPQESPLQNLPSGLIAKAEIPQTSTEIIPELPAQTTTSPDTRINGSPEQKAETPKPSQTVANSDTPQSVIPKEKVTESLHTEDIWEDDTEIKDRKRIRTAIVVSGIAGTNSPQNKSGIGPFKSQGILKAPTQTTLKQSSSEAHFGIPVSAGIGAKIHITERWAVGLGVNYTMLSSSFEGTYTKVEDGIVSPSITADVRNRQHYVGIPINAYFNIISRDFINFYTYAGGTVEKCVMNKYRIFSNPAITHIEKPKGVQLSANIGLGVEFIVGRHLGIYIDPSLRYYFDGRQAPSIRTAQPLMLGFEVGLRFNL